MWKAAMRVTETSEPIRLDQAGGSLLGKLPITVVVSLLVQAGLFVWWAAAMSARFDERLSQLQERTQRLEISLQRSSESFASLLDRLARAEEKIAVQSDRVRRTEQTH
jgi:septal ring factor EnvC (AmiA/AmiB activator)